MLLLTRSQILLMALGVSQGVMSKGCLPAGVPLPLTHRGPKGTEPVLHWALLGGRIGTQGTARLTWHRVFYLWLFTVGLKHIPCAPHGWEGGWDAGTAPSLHSFSLAQG